MNSTKQTLIKVSAVLSILDGIGMFIYGIVLLATVGDFGQSQTGYGQAINSLSLTKTSIILIGVFVLIFALSAFIGGILLLKENGRRAHYVWGVTLTIIGGAALSLSAIILYIALAVGAREMREDEVIYEERVTKKEVPKSPPRMDDQKLKRQMEILRQMRQNGEITDEEFKELMFELIRKV